MGGSLNGWVYSPKSTKESSISLIAPNINYPSKGSWLFPFPNRLANGVYSFDGQKFHFPLNDQGRPNALHGFLPECSFEIVESTDSKISVQYAYLGDKAFYPFPFTFKVEYLIVDQGVDVNIVICNDGETSMPAALGWHPYFSTEGLDTCSLEIGILEHIQVNELGVPSGEIQTTKDYSGPRSLANRVLDDCFRVQNDEDRVIVLYLNDRISIEVHQSEDFSHIQLYTPDRKSIAIEPMTSGINSLQTGDYKVLSPGETWQLYCGLKIKEY